MPDWDITTPEGTEWREAAYDPSPGGWRVPTYAELQTLLDASKVTNEWITQNGIYGRKFTDITSGLSVFLPAVGGYRSDSDGALSGTGGNYWSSTQNGSNYAYCLSLGSGRADWYIYNRRRGLSVRPVAE